MKPLDDVRQISALTYGFIASKALFAALDLDLFTKIAGGTTTLSALAEATGIAANRLRTLLTALKTTGLVTEAGGTFANAPATAMYLVDGAKGDFRDYVKVVNGGFLYEALRHLEKAMRGERIFADKGFYEGIVYSEGGVGGGSGAYTLAFLKQNPKLQATILDFPETTETARRYAAEAGMSYRVAHVQGNALTTAWPGEQDVVLMSYVWSAIAGRDTATLARRALEALKPGGLVLVHDFMVDDRHEGPSFAAWYLLAALPDNPDAECLTPGFVEAALRDAGFVIERTEPMLDEITQLTRARRP
jgi:2-hydroxy-4-(methylsulfanyl)butanoate S-methyltransferase